MLVRLTTEHPSYRTDFLFPSHKEGWVVTHLGKVSKAKKSNSLVALDCEMVLCHDGTENVVRVCVVDRNLKVKLDKLVNPNKDVLDYRTSITGVSADDLEGITYSLMDVQRKLKRILGHGTILVGHGLSNDLRALKIDHARIIDTSLIYKCKDDPLCRRIALNNLCKEVLGYELRKIGEPHNCLEDASAAMKLTLAKLEKGYDSPITREMPETGLLKLLLHRVPISVPPEELMQIFPDDSVEIQPISRVRNQRYSTFAIFRSAVEAQKAFDSLCGHEKKDSCGRSQKLMALRFDGGTATFYVRKMTVGDQEIMMNLEASYGKRSADEKMVTSPFKREKCNLHQCEHAKEVEKLKQKLRQREDELFNLQKVISSSTMGGKPRSSTCS